MPSPRFQRPRFQWHPAARAFAGQHEVTPQGGAPVANIPAQPAVDTFSALYRTLTSTTAFCVSDAARPDLEHIDPAQFATLTGGTSGRPKVILRSQMSWIRSFQANAARFGYTSDDRIAVLGTLDHSLALYGVLEGLHLGLAVHALSSLTPMGQMDALREHACTVLYATPTQLRLLAADKPLPTLRLILCGGGALTGTVRKHIATIAPHAKLYVFYGAAETSFVTLSDANTPEGSVGRAFEDVEIAVRPPDGTNTDKTNPDKTSAGLIWIRSPYLFARYLEGESPHTRWQDDWLTVGEYGTLDPNGYLFLRGRAGRMINIADTAVFPEDLEARISTLPEITQCAVLARPDPVRGHHLIAVLDGPENPAVRDTLLHHCRANGLTVPRAVLFLDPFPLLSSGKADIVQIAALTGAVL